MADLYHMNKASPAANGLDWFSYQWYTCRLLMKAGWLLKASSDASNKTGSADPINNKWGGPVATGASGTAGTIGARAGKDYNFSGLTGLVVPSKTNQGGSEGNILAITNAASPGNNVSWLITKVLTANTCLARPLVFTAVTHSAGTGPAMSISGHLCHTTRYNLRVVGMTNGQTVASGAAQVKISLDGGSNYASTVTIPATANSTGMVEIIDENGVHTGIYLNFAAGTIVTTDVWTANGAVASDANVGTIAWGEYSQITTAYNAMSNGAWLLLEGPSTLKIPFTAAPVGTFIRGENVVQTTTGAEGEIMGVTYEPSTGAGMLVIAPRVQGTGIHAEGWQQNGTNTYAITGAKSAATVNPNGTILIFCREVVWQRGSNLFDGTIYYQCTESANEATSRFSYLTNNGSGCTNTIAPGEGGTNNGFPGATTGTYVVLGTAGSVGHCLRTWNRTAYANTNNLSNSQNFVANCIDKQNTSQDGSWFVAQGQPADTVISAGYQPFLMRLDNGEEGDLEPYAFFAAEGTAYGGIRTYNAARTSGNNSFNSNLNASVFMQGGTSAVIETINTWRRRGYATGDAFIDCECWFLGRFRSNSTAIFQNSNIISIPDRVSHSLQITPPIVVDFPVIGNPGDDGLRKVRKGVPRWIGCCSGNVGYDTFGGKTWCQVGMTQGIAWNDQAFLMPWDGSTVPVQ
jgi:hypothetical protein